jgi:hypothetical protein
LAFLRSSLVNFEVFAMNAVNVLFYGADIQGGLRLGFFRPFGAEIFSGLLPRACAVGCILAPLRG